MAFLTPRFSHQFNGLVWRMEIDPITATLLAEIRNEQEKQVTFTSVNLKSGKLNFDHLITNERWLTGMEAAYHGVLYLYYYQSAGSPAHKGIIAVDVVSGQVLWQNYNDAFDHMSINGPVLFDTRLQPRKLFIANSKTGATLHAYNSLVDVEAASEIVLPDMVDGAILPQVIAEQVPFGNMIHNHYHNRYRIVSLHTLNNTELSQCLYIFEDDQLLFTDILNTGIQKLQPEAFVLHHNYLIYLKNRSELNVINL